MPPTLSYITATKNKLPYFKQGIERLIAHKKPDEEILVADGASTDGTPEYLAELKAAGKIDWFVSEPDFAESHALNKLFLAARGEVIKIINDDDAYYFPTIEACKKFMLEHPEIDFMGTEGGSFKHETPERQVIRKVAGYEQNFRKWKSDHTPFEFAVLGLMFRRSSLPVLGFWDLSFKNADAEYTFRSTAGPAKLAWCLNPSFVFIRTKEGVTMNNLKRMREEALRLRKFYLGENPPSPLLIAVKRPFRNMREMMSARKSEVLRKAPGSASDTRGESWAELYQEGEQWLIEQNRGKEFEFLS
ncbi:MAG: glycosyltransferase [Candidatus Sungbacteria bacterium]|nr:glycosyltransferase [Candidatus Sungbacteria bacterium]